MGLTFEPLGKYVRLVDERNTNMVTESVLGINIDKYFMPSVANVIGTDLSNYKLLRKGRFACNPMHVGRDGRLPVSRYTEDVPAIVSPAYFMFEIIDENEIEPEYLMLCFRRPDFDRMCWFRTDASVRGGITWEDVCALTIPVPPISEQRKIVHDYQVITDRIELLWKMNENLEAQAIEMCSRDFPLSDEKNENGMISDICSNIYSGGTPATSEDDYWDGDLPWLSSGETSNSFVTKTDKHISQAGVDNSSTKLAKAGSTVIASAGQGKTRGQTSLLFIDTYVNQSVVVLSPKKGYEYILFSNLKARYDEMRQLSDLDSIRGSLTTKSIGSLPFKDSGNTELNKKLQPMFDTIKHYAFEIDQLESLKDMMLVKM